MKEPISNLERTLRNIEAEDRRCAFYVVLFFLFFLGTPLLITFRDSF